MVVLVLLTVLTAFAASLLVWSASWLWYENLPPGPRPLPIVGNLLVYRKAGFTKLAEKYGSIYTIWMGSRPCIMVSGAELIHDALIKQADSFSNRSQPRSTMHMSCNFRTVNSSHGPLWQKLRRNLIFEVLNSTRVRSYKPVRDTEFQNLLKRFKEEAKDNNGVVHVMPLIRRTLFNILNTICFGERMEESVVREIDALMVVRVNTIRGGLSDYIPILRLFEQRKVRHLKEVIKRTNELMSVGLERIREQMANGEPVSGRYVETLLQLQAKEGKETFPDENIFALCAEVLNAGTDTTAHTTEWILARIVANPEIQRKLVDEMKTVLGEKTIEESDIESLPYLRAVVKETQRMDGPFSFTLSHAVSRRGAKLGGFSIPTNALLLFRLKSVSEDAEIWGDPENFRPERFLKDMASVDMTGTKKMALIPFGAGRRICPGMNLALLTIQMTVGLLVQSFEWSYGEPGEVDFSLENEARGSMKKPLKAHIRDRLRSAANTTLSTASTGK